MEYIKLEANQDRVSIFDDLKIGQEVEVSFNLRGRPWTNKEGVTTYFNSIIAWRVTKLGGQPASATPPNYAEMQAPVDINGIDEDDVPF